ncbi:hypothetical protein A3F66_02835 [candidate division TM6 bacterium RIFCSPHIGHO2_12_FULL_32_22]|nr:MAG: hypothetical protein A3F66_02835 [candidate division TM6 bacterium RIFCSPHIGHO2_12_FULL_32_22]
MFLRTYIILLFTLSNAAPEKVGLNCILKSRMHAREIISKLDTQLMKAIENDNQKEVVRLLNLGANPNYIERCDKCILSSVQSPEMAQLLISRGADVNLILETSPLIENRDCSRPLTLVGQIGSIEILKTLIQAGALFYKESCLINTSIWWAFQSNGNTTRLELVLEAGCYANPMEWDYSEYPELEKYVTTLLHDTLLIHRKYNHMIYFPYEAKDFAENFIKKAQFPKDSYKFNMGMNILIQKMKTSQLSNSMHILIKAYAKRVAQEILSNSKNLVKEEYIYEISPATDAKSKIYKNMNFLELVKKQFNILLKTPKIAETATQTEDSVIKKRCSCTLL